MMVFIAGKIGIGKGKAEILQFLSAMAPGRADSGRKLAEETLARTSAIEHLPATVG